MARRGQPGPGRWRRARLRRRTPRRPARLPSRPLPQQLAVVAQGQDDQAATHRPQRPGRGHRSTARRAGEQPGLALDQPPERPGRRRGERGHAAGSALRTQRAAWISSANTTRQPRSRSPGRPPPGRRRGCSPGRRPRRSRGLRIAPVTTTGSGRGAAGRAGTRSPRWCPCPDHHGPGRSRRDLLPDHGGQLDDVPDGQRGAGHGAELVPLDLDAGAVPARARRRGAAARSA